jgi:hypothetical protein
MRNEPNFSKSQIFVTLIKTTNYSKKCKLDTWSKRTQTKPILSAAQADKIALSVVEGPIKTNIQMGHITALRSLSSFIPVRYVSFLVISLIQGFRFDMIALFDRGDSIVRRIG